jgi:hypothetical protein
MDASPIQRSVHTQQQGLLSVDKRESTFEVRWTGVRETHGVAVPEHNGILGRVSDHDEIELNNKCSLLCM